MSNLSNPPALPQQCPLSSYPFLKALCWQAALPDLTTLTELEILQIYERGWRYRGALAEPSENELALIRELASRHCSWLSAHV